MKQAYSGWLLPSSRLNGQPEMHNFYTGMALCLKEAHRTMYGDAKEDTLHMAAAYNELSYSYAPELKGIAAKHNANPHDLSLLISSINIESHDSCNKNIAYVSSGLSHVKEFLRKVSYYYSLSKLQYIDPSDKRK